MTVKLHRNKLIPHLEIQGSSIGIPGVRQVSHLPRAKVQRSARGYKKSPLKQFTPKRGICLGNIYGSDLIK